MNKKILIQKMIENRFLEDNDEENLEKYCEAFEDLSDIMDESFDITTEEMCLIVQSFSNKENHTYFLDMLEDAILLHLDKTNEYELFFNEVIKNKDGFVESLSVLYGIWVYHKEMAEAIQDCLSYFNEDMLEYAFDNYGYNYDEAFKRLVMIK